MFGFGLELPFQRYGVVAAGGVIAFQAFAVAVDSVCGAVAVQAAQGIPSGVFAVEHIIHART